MEVQIIGDHLEELAVIDTRVEDKRELDVLGFQVVPQAFEHGGLAGAHFARKDDEPLAALDTVNEVGQGFFMLFAAVQEGRIGAETEGTLGETEEGVVHSDAFGSQGCPLVHLNTHSSPIYVELMG